MGWLDWEKTKRSIVAIMPPWRPVGTPSLILNALLFGGLWGLVAIGPYFLIQWQEDWIDSNFGLYAFISTLVIGAYFFQLARYYRVTEKTAEILYDFGKSIAEPFGPTSEGLPEQERPKRAHSKILFLLSGPSAALTVSFLDIWWKSNEYPVATTFQPIKVGETAIFLASEHLKVFTFFVLGALGVMAFVVFIVMPFQIKMRENVAHKVLKARDLIHTNNAGNLIRYAKALRVGSGPETMQAIGMMAFAAVTLSPGDNSTSPASIRERAMAKAEVLITLLTHYSAASRWEGGEWLDVRLRVLSAISLFADSSHQHVYYNLLTNEGEPEILHELLARIERHGFDPEYKDHFQEIRARLVLEIQQMRGPDHAWHKAEQLSKVAIRMREMAGLPDEIIQDPEMVLQAPEDQEPSRA